MTTTNRDVVMLDVLQIMARRWNHKFAPSEVRNLLAMWREKCADIPAATLLETAQDVIRDWPDGPPPSHIAFAAEARKRVRAASGEESQPTYEGPKPITQNPNWDRAGKIILRLRTEFGWAVGMRVWSKLLDSAGHPDTRKAWEDGHVPDYKVDEAIEAEHNRVEELRQQHHVEPIEPASTFREWRSSKAIPRAKQRA